MTSVIVCPQCSDCGSGPVYSSITGLPAAYSETTFAVLSPLVMALQSSQTTNSPLPMLSAALWQPVWSNVDPR